MSNNTSTVAALSRGHSHKKATTWLQFECNMTVHKDTNLQNNYWCNSAAYQKSRGQSNLTKNAASSCAQILQIFTRENVWFKRCFATGASPSPQTKKHLDWLIHFCRGHRQIHRHTDRPCYIDSNRPHLCTLCMQCSLIKNTGNYLIQHI